MPHRVLVSDAKVLDLETHGDPLEAVDARIETTDAKRPDELVEAAEGADALIVDALTQVTREVLEGVDSLRVVGRGGIGVDNIDVGAAADNGVTVVNVPDYALEEVSTHSLGLLLGCLRRLGRYDRAVKGGEWDWALGAPIHRFRDETVGLVAFGEIARRLASKLRGFDVDVVAADPYVSEAEMEEFGVERVGFDELLGRARYVSVHAPLTDETRGLFDADAFGAMRDGSILINTARGPIVDEAALADALENGPLAAAGLDVREEEPPGTSPLHDRDDVLLTPHAAWYSEESRAELSHTVSEDVARVLSGETPTNPVDPETGWY